jgi:hypothetical protein
VRRFRTLKLGHLGFKGAHVRKYIFFFSLALVVGCNYQTPKSMLGADSSASVIAGEQTIGWSLIQKQVLNNCFSCHSGLVPPTFISSGDVKINLNSILSVTYAGSMPPSSSGSPKLTACQEAILNEWSKAGAPNQTDILVSSLTDCKSGNITSAPPPTVTPPAPVPTVAYIDWSLINSRVVVSCSACHGSSFNTYSSASKKIQSILGVVRSNAMPPRNPLSACQKTLLNQWANAGTPQATKIKVSDFPECAGFI